MQANKLVCSICEGAISYSSYLQQKQSTFLVCLSLECKNIFIRRDKIPTATFEFQKNAIVTRKKKIDEEQVKIKSAIKKEAKENDNIVSKILTDYSELASNTQLLVIPLGLNDQEPTPKERLDLYETHLRKVIKQAVLYSDPSEVIHDEHYASQELCADVDNSLQQLPVLHKTLDALCGMCKGGCCVSGRNHAYISGITIRRFMDESPNVSEEEVLDMYLSKVGPQSIPGSCINQTLKGCSLNRDLRSDICNGYYCRPLKVYKQKVVDRGSDNSLVQSEPVIVIQRSHSDIHRFNSSEENPIAEVAIAREGELQLLGACTD